MSLSLYCIYYNYTVYVNLQFDYLMQLPRTCVALA